MNFLYKKQEYFKHKGHEGHKGKPSVFIRITSCTLCPSCSPALACGASVNPFGFDRLNLTSFGLPELRCVDDKTHHLPLLNVVVTGKADITIRMSKFAGIDFH